MVNPEESEAFCPMLGAQCAGRKCVAMMREVKHWTNEGIGDKNFYSQRVWQCRHYPEVRIMGEVRK